MSSAPMVGNLVTPEGWKSFKIADGDLKPGEASVATHLHTVQARVVV